MQQSQHDLIVDFERHISVAIATRIVDLAFGRAVITDDLPEVFDSNVVWIDAPAAVPDVLHAIEEVAAAAGWRHRSVECSDPAVADHFRPALTRSGYTEERYITMELVEPPPPVAAGATLPTAVVTIADQLELARTMLGEEPWADRAALLDQFDRRELRIAETVHARSIIAPPDDPVSRALLMWNGTIADLDAVATLRAHRGQGWSGAVVRRAINVALEKGVDHIVLVADDDDWPRHWYARLGFRQAGRLSMFRRPPDSN